MNNQSNFRKGHRQEYKCREKGFQRGPSSFYMHNNSHVFEKLNLKKGDTFLDLGCGAGDYSIHAAKIVGESGIIYALDLWPEMLNKICEDAMTQGINNIHPIVSDIRKKIDISDASIDVCLISNVLHMMDLQTDTNLFIEIKRILKPGGIIAVIECNIENCSFGPPLHLRISAEELEKSLGKNGFLKTDFIDLGNNYMMLFDICHKQ